MSIRLSTLLPALMLVATSSNALAGDPPIAIAEQVAIDYTSGTGFGDANHQQFAQVFRVRGDGYVTHVMVPMNCVTAPEPTLVVTIQSLNANGYPSGVVLASEAARGWRVDSVTGVAGEVGMRMIEFTTPARVSPGKYALTLRASGGICQLWYGPLGDTYPDGTAFLSTMISRIPAGQWNHVMPRDLAFQVYWKAL